MFEKKKILVKTVFEKAKGELSKNGKSPRAAYLNSLFEEKFGFTKNERTFVRYYTNLVEKGRDQEIDGITLNQLSQYIGYKNYDDFCKNGDFTEVNQDSAFTTVNIRIDDQRSHDGDRSNLTINITTAPVFRLNEFLTKQNKLGIIGMLLIAGLFLGKTFIKPDTTTAGPQHADTLVRVLNYPAFTNDTVPQPSNPDQKQKDARSSIAEQYVQNQPDLQEYYIHWNGERFIPSDAHLLVQFKVIPIHNGQLKYFQKITRPDTITEASLHKVWYSKSNNQVEFFTADGENPEDNQLLRQLSIHMYNQYIKNY